MNDVATLPDRPTETPRIALATDVKVLRLGPWHLPEFSTATAAIAESHHWQQAECLENVIHQLTSGAAPPDLLLWAQPLPGSIHQYAVDQLLRLAPLLRIVVVAGTWCEGEMRNGNPPTGVFRMYWYEFSLWWKRATERLAQGAPPPWSAPLTAPLAGRYLAENDTDRAQPSAPIVVASPDFAVFETLTSAVAGKWTPCQWWRGHRSDYLPEEVSAGIWDGAQFDSEELVRFNDFAAAIRDRGGRVVALLDFSRVEHFEMLPGVAILGKPYFIEELRAACGLA